MTRVLEWRNMNMYGTKAKNAERRRNIRSNDLGVGIVGYLVLALFIIIGLAVVVFLFGPVMLILGAVVIGGVLLAAFGPPPYAQIGGIILAAIGAIGAIFVYMGSAGGLGF